MPGVPAYIRSPCHGLRANHWRAMDNGPEFIAQAVRDWIAAIGAKTAFIEPGSPLSGHRHAMPCRAVHGRTDTARASMPGSGTSCQTERSSKRCAKPRSPSKAGENTTTPSVHTVPWATAHRPRKPSSRWIPGQSCPRRRLHLANPDHCTCKVHKGFVRADGLLAAQGNPAEAADFV